MKMYLEFEVKAIVEPTEPQKAQGVKNVISFFSEEMVNGLKQINVITIKSVIPVEQKYLNKVVLAEVQQVVIGSESKFSKPKVYYKILNLNLKSAQ